MKNIISVLVLTLAILFSGCNKGKFTCKITSPQDGARVLITKDLTVTVEAKDSKSTIVRVLLDIDGLLPVYELVTEPFIFTIPSKALYLGKHTLTAFAVNLEGESVKTSITINVVENFDNEKESPDFVTFTNGQFPVGWITYTWEIDNKMGVDDNYSLRSANYPALVFANKTMALPGYVEFYSNGNNIDFFIDDVMVQAVSSAPAGNWEKRIYALDTGKHQLKWQAEGVNKYIDAIKFYTSE